ncbi:hypothetical protein MRX96_010667 [Rhipicephalus microplus]
MVVSLSSQKERTLALLGGLVLRSRLRSAVHPTRPLGTMVAPDPFLEDAFGASRSLLTRNSGSPTPSLLGTPDTVKQTYSVPRCARVAEPGSQCAAVTAIGQVATAGISAGAASPAGGAD